MDISPGLTPKASAVLILIAGANWQVNIFPFFSLFCKISLSSSISNFSVIAFVPQAKVH